MRATNAWPLVALIALGACDATQRNALDEAADGANSSVVEQKVEAEAQAVMEPLSPPEPGTAGGLPSVPPPTVEGSIDPKSGQGAAQVVQGYYGLLEEKRFADALKQWGDGGIYGSTDPVAFAHRFDGFSEIHANVGAPGEGDGGAGSIYISVPVQVYARIKATGKPYYSLRMVSLRRVNDVDGATEAQRRWHITQIGPYVAPVASAPADAAATDTKNPAPSN